MWLWVLAPSALGGPCRHLPRLDVTSGMRDTCRRSRGGAQSAGAGAHTQPPLCRLQLVESSEDVGLDAGTLRPGWALQALVSIGCGLCVSVCNAGYLQVT